MNHMIFFEPEPTIERQRKSVNLIAEYDGFEVPVKVIYDIETESTKFVTTERGALHRLMSPNDILKDFKVISEFDYEITYEYSSGEREPEFIEVINKKITIK